MMKKAVILILLVSLVIGVPVLLKYRNANSKEVEVTTPSERVIRTSVLASGRLAHDDQVRLSSEVIAKVKQVLVKEGDYVSKGQLLLILDDETFKANVEQSKAAVRMQQIAINRQIVQLSNLESQWQRKKKLHQQKLLDDDAFDAFTSQLELAKIDVESAKESLLQAKAQLAQAEDRLNKTRVVSPIDGKVTSLDIKEGETAIASTTNIAGSALMTIANPDSTITEVFVDEADIADIRIGQSAKVVAIAYPDHPIEGIVKSIASSAKTASGRQGLSFLVKLDINKQQGIALKPGMSCRAEIFTQSTDPVQSLPLQAIITEEKRSENVVERHVFVVENGITVKKAIVTGISDDSFQQIVDGITQNAQVIIGPDKTLRHLTDGESVIVQSNQ